MKIHCTLIPLALLLLALAACVPSPTATPLPQSPFPTLPLPTDTMPPEPTLTVPPTTPSSSPTPKPTQPSPVTAPTLPINADNSPAADTLPPLVQLTVQDIGLPVSLDQTTSLALIGADNIGVSRFDVYDNDVLYAQATAPQPAPSTFSNIVSWKANSLGRHTLRAVAYDMAGNSSDAAQVELNVINNNRAPNVIIVSPGSSKNAEIGAPLIIQGVATDDVAVTRMELVVDGQVVTYITPDSLAGVSPFGVTLSWTPTTTGLHSIVLRAYDNRRESDDSLRISVRVFDNQPPVVTARVERETIPTGDALLVNALALANNGVAQLELYVDDRLIDTVRSGEPSIQTALEAQLVWADNAIGEHSYFVRAYDMTGQTTDTPRQTIRVREADPRIVRETPPSRATSTALPPTATPTPTLVVPDPPVVQVTTADGKPSVVLPGPLKLRVTAHSSVELAQIELWARYPGEADPQLLASEIIKGATDKIFEYDWSPPHAGVIEFTANVADALGQMTHAAPLQVYLLVPPAPTAVPLGFDFAHKWVAASPATPFEVTFVQVGQALRGILIETRPGGMMLPGKIVSGVAQPDHIFFAVDFAPVAHTLDFNCTFRERPPTLTCNYEDENGSRGSAVFNLATP